MTNMKTIGTALVLSLSTLASAATVADCCADGAPCCEKGAACCDDAATAHRDHAMENMAH
jgi:hypothetical protein